MTPASTAAVVLLMLALSASQAGAQERPRPQAGGAFVGGSFALWTGHGAEADPDGAGYIRPHFHGSPEWPAAGAAMNAGVFVWRGWSLGGELAVRRPQTVPMLEQGRFKYESWETTSTYTDRELLMSILGGRLFNASRSVDVHAVGGMTWARGGQKVTDRQYTYTWYGGTISRTLPDRELKSTDRGMGGGADVLFRVARSLSLTAGARLHWIKRPEVLNPDRIAPDRDPWVLQFSAGARWRSR